MTEWEEYQQMLAAKKPQTEWEEYQQMLAAKSSPLPARSAFAGVKYQPSMAADATAVSQQAPMTREQLDAGVQQPDVTLDQMFSPIPQGTTQNLIERLRSTKGIIPAPFGMDALLTKPIPARPGMSGLERTGAVVNNALANIPEMAIGMTMGAVESPISTAKGLAIFYPDIANTVYNAIADDVPSWQRDEAIKQMTENPLNFILAALPLLKVRAPKVAESVIQSIGKPTVEPSARIVQLPKDEPVATSELSAKAPVTSEAGTGVEPSIATKPAAEFTSTETSKLAATPSPSGETTTAPKAETPTVKLPTIKTVETTPESVGPVGLKKVEIQKLRSDYELDQLPPPKRKSVDMSFEEAKQRGLDESALLTADEVLNNGRPITDAEHAGMALKATKLADEFTESRADIASLVDKGDTQGAEVARVRSEAIRDQLDKLTEAAEKTGTEAGRALNIRKMMVNREVYDLAHVIQEARISKGSKLTEAEVAHLEKVTNEVARLELENAALEAKYQESLAAQEKLRAERIANREVRKARVSARAKTSIDKLLAERASIKKQIAEMGYRVNDITGVTAEGSYLVGKLAVNYIREGATTLAEVVQKVLIDLPELTERDVWRAMNARNPNLQRKARGETTKKIAQLKTQARLLIDIEKAEAGVFDKPQGKSPQPAEIRVLQKKLRELRMEAYRSGLHPSQLERAIRKINELQDQLENHYRTLRKGKKLESAELADARAKAREIRSALRTEDALIDLNEQLRTGEFVIKEKPEPRQLSPEHDRAKVQLAMARKKVKIAISEMAPMTAGKIFGEVANFNRAARATADMSGWFRQNVIPVFSHPIKSAKLSPAITKAFFSNFQAEKIDYQIRNNPRSYLYDKSGLVLRELEGIPIRREESFMSRFIEKIPIVKVVAKASNRNMSTMGNLIRTSLFDDFLAKNPNATTIEMKAYANALNVFTGIGDLGSFAPAANALSLGLFAPKLAVSRFQTPWMMKKYWSLPRVRKAMARDLVGFVATGTTILALAKVWEGQNKDVQVGDDFRDSDFGKIRVGNTRVDIWGGFQQPARLVARLGAVVTDRTGLTGRELSDYEKNVDPFELLGRFAAYKVAPIWSLSGELLTGKTMVGDSTTVPASLLRSVTPMIIEDIRDAYRDAGINRAIGVGSAGFLGVGVNTYKDSERQTRIKISDLQNAGKQSEADATMKRWNDENPKNKIVSVIKGKYSEQQVRDKIATLRAAGDYTAATALQKQWNLDNPKNKIITIKTGAKE